MYQHGDLKFGEVLDSRFEDEDGVCTYPYAKGFYLPHSCNEWFIGDADALRALASDIAQVLEGK